ncbi:MAG: hypothetical protein ABIE94_02145, partial [archaeon]
MAKKKGKTALESLTTAKRRRLEDEVVPAYMEFLENGRVPQQVVDQVVEMAKEAGLREYNLWGHDSSATMDEFPNGAYITDRDGTQFALILPGQQPTIQGGISFIGTHVDAPCLNLRGGHIIEGKEGVVLGGQPYGGIWNHTWLDRQVKLIGRVPVGDEIYEVEFD